MCADELGTAADRPQPVDPSLVHDVQCDLPNLIEVVGVNDVALHCDVDRDEPADGQVIGVNETRVVDGGDEQRLRVIVFDANAQFVVPDVEKLASCSDQTHQVRDEPLGPVRCELVARSVAFVLASSSDRCGELRFPPNSGQVFKQLSLRLSGTVRSTQD
ncbi:hypothetical protein [Amycolatopsis sp. NBC_01480]|uniref:hypothetical protein n=1 Tax=Amycolatopsis sp. NBC_01480 TaxID=2903562 RepID=UPI002E2943BA|nr:hypothetical protein [Amycolatopsis sp. NBC_01480]